MEMACKGFVHDNSIVTGRGIRFAEKSRNNGSSVEKIQKIRLKRRQTKWWLENKYTPISKRCESGLTFQILRM